MLSSLVKFRYVTVLSIAAFLLYIFWARVLTDASICLNISEMLHVHLFLGTLQVEHVCIAYLHQPIDFTWLGQCKHKRES